MRSKILKILKEEGDDKRERFIKSAKKLGFILETEVNSNLITDIEINNITYDPKYNEIAGDINITSWCEDPDLFEFFLSSHIYLTASSTSLTQSRPKLKPKLWAAFGRRLRSVMPGIVFTSNT